MLGSVPRNLREAKRELRHRLAARRRAVPRTHAAAAAEACAAHLLGEPAVREARRVALYAALPDELPTRPLFEALGGLDLERLLPRIRPGRVLDFVRVARWEDLSPGRFGVPQPPSEAASVILGRGDLILTPGLAFDRQGWRLGRGGGYYDRTFASLKGPRLVGLGYAFQLLAAVPHDSHDRPVDAIVSERGWLWAALGEAAGE
jgi:5-formyltetrahydrofolate cyclo-ligase